MSDSCGDCRFHRRDSSRKPLPALSESRRRAWLTPVQSKYLAAVEAAVNVKAANLDVSQATERLSVEELRARYGEPKPPKYGNRRCQEDGHSFDSEAELDRYRELKLLEKGRAIRHLTVHPSFALHFNGQRLGFYEGDFSYHECPSPTGSLVVEDKKGVQTALFRWKARHFCAEYPQHELRIIPVK